MAMLENQLTIKACENGIRFSDGIQPKSFQNEISGIYIHFLKIRLTSSQVDGAANKTCIKCMAKWLGVSPSAVCIVSGLSSKNKTIEVDAIDESVFF